MTAARLDIDVRPGDVADWDELVAGHPDAGPMHWAGWWRVLAEGFAVTPRYLRAVDAAGATAAVLPLYESRGLLAGHHVASLAGGALARDEPAAAAIVERARALWRDSGARYLLLRGGPHGAGASRVEPAAHTVADLAGGAEAAWKRLSSNTRRKVRKAGKHGYAVADRDRFAESFYPIYARNLRDLGTPVPGRALFDGIERELAGRWRFLAVERDGRPCGGMVLIENRGAWSSLYVAIPRELLGEYPTYLLYWTAMERAADAGAARFDFGRSVRGSGTHAFKQQFGADVDVPYAVFQRGGRPVAPLRSGRGAVSRAWARLPLRLANAAGPLLRRKLPFA